LPSAGESAGLAVAHEAFADRRYEDDGALTPRRETGAVIDDVEAAVAQALAIVTRGEVMTRHGKALHIRAQTICVHGDRPDAATFARRLREALRDAGVEITALPAGRAV
jgi:UPF0271 protein